MTDEFELLFSNEVLKPQEIIGPMKQEHDDITEEWGELYGVNITKDMFSITTENLGDIFTVFVDGVLERIHPLTYEGSINHCKIVIEENNDCLHVTVPMIIKNFVLQSFKMMDREVQTIGGEFDNVCLEHHIGGGRGAFPFSLTLSYRLA